MLLGHVNFVEGFSRGQSMLVVIEKLDMLDMKDKISLAE